MAVEVVICSAKVPLILLLAENDSDTRLLSLIRFKIYGGYTFQDEVSRALFISYFLPDMHIIIWDLVFELILQFLFISY